MKTMKRMVPWLLGGILFSTLFYGQFHYFQKREDSMRRSFSLILNEKKSLENHLQFLQKREEQLHSRMSQAEEKINSFNR